MNARPLLATALAAAVLTAVPMTAQAKELALIDRSTYDAAATVDTSSVHVAHATAGELGGFLDLTIRAQDGSLPATRGACETADVDAVLTVAPGEVLSVRTTGDLCMHQFAPVLVLNAAYDGKDLSYSGTAHRKAKGVGDGLIAASNSLGFGFGASFSGSVRW